MLFFVLLLKSDLLNGGVKRFSISSSKAVLFPVDDTTEALCRNVHVETVCMGRLFNAQQRIEPKHLKYGVSLFWKSNDIINHWNLFHF